MAEQITNTVYALRTEKGLTQEKLAEKVGVTRQTIISIEKGDYTPSVALALRLAKTFKCKIEDLFALSS